MAGEMGADEVTRENYPDLFQLRDELAAAGVESEPRPFDQYQGPYLYVDGPGACVWYDSEDEEGSSFLIERGPHYTRTFETRGATYLPKKKEGELRHGSYSVEAAALRLVALARKAKAAGRIA
jgi:hypothetical protein